MDNNIKEIGSRKYAANKGNYLVFIILSFLIPGIYIGILSFKFQELVPFSMISFVPFLFLMWIYFTTSYQIINKTIFYRSAFLRGSINIDAVTLIELVNRPKDGVRPALGATGLLIYYGDDKSVFLAPADPKEFLKNIQDLNASIKVVRKLSVSQY